MTTDDTLAELLLQWEELHEQGRDVPAEELCRDCPQLAAALADRIRALKATAWMDGPDDDGGSPPDPPGPDTPPPTLAGRYRLDERVGEGGFAEVWKGFDLELRRAVAVKLPKPGRLPSTERFLAEARRIARLKHPGVVPVFDVGQDAGSCFIVSEFVEGGSLAARIATNRPAHHDAARMVAEVAETLAYAHRQGFVHRDIKPGNILLDHHGRALLTDFGIAHTPDDTNRDGFGTLAYMSPEQVEGQPVDHRTDIYGLGVVLHELLTGKLPFEASDPVRLRRLIVAGAPTPIPGVSRAGDHVCRKCLGRNPADRYQDAATLAHDLRRTDFTQRPTRHGRRLFAVGAVALIGLGGFFAVRTALDRNPLPVAGPRTTLDSERRAVEWVYSVGGSVNDTKRFDQLAEPWAVRTVYLHRDRCVGKVTDAGLTQLEGLPDLDTLNLGGAKIDGGGLAHLRASKRLKWLSLECTPVDDAGLAHVAAFPDIAYLNLLSTPVTDASVDVLMKLPRLEMVVVSGTRMTEAGIGRLRMALPSCRVASDAKPVPQASAP